MTDEFFKIEISTSIYHASNLGMLYLLWTKNYYVVRTKKVRTHVLVIKKINH